MDINRLSPIEKNYQNARLNLNQWVPIALVMLLATVLYFYGINSEGLWIDELTSIEDAHDSHWKFDVRPFYFILLGMWMQLGNSDAWLRSLSVIFAIATIFLLYRLGRQLIGEKEGLIAASMLTLSPLFINHAQEVRMYVVSTCLGVAGTLFLANAVTGEKLKNPRHVTLAGWCVLRLLAIITVPLNVTLLFADVCIYGLRFRQHRPALIRFGIWLVLLILLWSPFVLSVFQAIAPDSAYASHHPGRNPPTLANIVRTLKFWTVWPFSVQANVIASNFYRLVTALVAGMIGLAVLQKHRSSGVLWAITWFTLPLVPIIAFSFMSIPIWVNRYLLFVSPYLFLVLAAGLSRLWRQWRLAAIAIALIYLIAAGGGMMRYYAVQDRPDYKFIVETIEQNEQPEDIVVWSLFARKVVLDHYYQGTSPVYSNKTRGVRSDAEISQWLTNFPDAPDRLWVALRVHEDAYPRFEQQIKTQYTLEEKYQYEQGSKLLLLTKTFSPK